MNTVIKKYFNRDNFSFWLELVKEVFYASLITYFIFFFIDILVQGFVSNFINLKYLLAVVIFSGIVTILFHSEEKTESEQSISEEFSKKNYIFTIFIAIFGGLIIWYRSRDLGWISFLIAFLSVFIIFLFAVLFFNDENKNNLV